MEDSSVNEDRQVLLAIRNLIALLVADRHETLVTKAEVLSRAGLTPKLIAELMGTTANTVSVALYSSKKKKKKDSSKKAGKKKRAR